MNKRLSKLPPLLLLLLVCCFAHAQHPRQAATDTSTYVSGKVVTDKYLPIPGATIQLLDSKHAINTNNSGEFRLRRSKGDTAMQVSFIGFQTQVLPLGSNITVVLKDAASDMNEVVVVAYGKQKKISVTGAIATVGTKELKQSPVANLSNALAGRLPGLVTVQTSGEPGYDGAALWIRGMATFTGSQSPLILVDGVERSFSGIDANEVESISILKDASSTAVYGVRGANGVILVTTKRGTNSKPQINFTLQDGIQEPTRLPQYLDAYDALSLYKQALINDGQNYAMYTDEYLNKFRDRSHPAYQYLYPNVDWLHTLLKPTSPMYSGNLNVSGGNNFVRYFTSISYLRQSGLYRYANLSDYDIQALNNKYNFRTNIDLNITKDLSMELNLGEIIYDNNYPNVSASALFADMQSIPPYLYPMQNPDGSVAYQSSKPYNPFGRLTQGGYQRNFENTLQATTGAKLEMPWITKGLSTRVRLSFDSYNYRNVTRAKSYYTYQWAIADDQATDLSQGTYTKITDGSNNLSYDVAANSNRRTQVEAYLNYDRTFGKHAVTAMALYQQQSFFDAIGSGDAINGLPYKYNGVVGRLTYNYAAKLFGEINFGYNGSENFPSGRRYDLFPAFSASYVISEEPYFKEHVRNINLLKLRASAGTVGNDKIGGQRFLYQSTWSLAGSGYQFGRNHDGSYFGGTVEDRTGNPAVTWEKANKYNLGLDAEFFGSALSFTGDVFYEDRKNILATPGTIPGMIGIVNLPYVNLGEVKNKGFEVSLEYRKHFARFGYFVKGNYSFNINRIIRMDEPSYEGHTYQRHTGRSIDDQYGYKALGFFSSQDDIDKSPDQSSFGQIQPGDIKYEDINKDGVVNSMDQTYLGKRATPNQIMGLALGGDFKGFDLSVLFQGGFGGNTWFTGPRMWPFSGDAGVLSDIKGNYWTPEHMDAKYPRLSYAANQNNDQNSTLWLFNSNYVRLKNLEVGYTLPNRLSGHYGIRSLRVFANALNLYTWDKIKIFDPETPNDSGNYPQMRVFNFGLTLGL